MSQTPTSDRIRLTISVTPEVHVAYTRLSKASGSSIGREMGDWLGSTLEAVELTASMIERARVAPQLALREINAHAEALQEVLKGDLADLFAEMGGGAGSASAAALVAAKPVPSPPSSNTGGKVPRENPKTTSRGGAAKPTGRSSSSSSSSPKRSGSRG